MGLVRMGLEARPEGEGTMLDNTLLVLCTEVSDGNTHSHDDMGFILAGVLIGPGVFGLVGDYGQIEALAEELEGQYDSEELSAGEVDEILEAGRREPQEEEFQQVEEVEDDEMVRSLTRAMLERMGYSVLVETARRFTDPDEAHVYIQHVGAPIVIKATGLCAGKGVAGARIMDRHVIAVDFPEPPEQKDHTPLILAQHLEHRQQKQDDQGNDD